MNKVEMTGFVDRVAALLNAQNPNALAVLHARSGRVNGRMLQVINESVAAVQAVRPELQFNINMVNGRFHSLLMRPSATNGASPAYVP